MSLEFEFSYMTTAVIAEMLMSSPKYKPAPFTSSLCPPTGRVMSGCILGIVSDRWYGIQVRGRMCIAGQSRAAGQVDATRR